MKPGYFIQYTRSKYPNDIGIVTKIYDYNVDAYWFIEKRILTITYPKYYTVLMEAKQRKINV